MGSLKKRIVGWVIGIRLSSRNGRWITTDAGSSWIMMSISQRLFTKRKTYRSSNVAVRKQNKYQSQGYWHLTNYIF